jgi:hypothetical protein
MPTLNEFLDKALKDQDKVNEGRGQELAKRIVQSFDKHIKDINKGIRVGSKNIVMSGVQGLEKELDKLTSFVTKDNPDFD